MKLFFIGLLLSSVLLLVALPSVQVRSATPANVAAPSLKWAYGGCFTSSCQVGWYSSPAVADLNGDGSVEVLWGSYDLVALQGASGNLVWRAPSKTRIWPGVALADLEGDGALDIVVGRDEDRLTVYSAAGVERWSRSPFGEGELRTLALADLEQDGTTEVLVGRAASGSTKQINVFEANGARRTGWPARRDGDPGIGWGVFNQNLAVADLTGDGIAEIIAPTDTHHITGLRPDGSQLPVNPMYGEGKVWSQVGFHVDHAVDLRGYARCGSEHRPNFASSAPLIDDLDGDGTREMVVIGNVYVCGTEPYIDLYMTPFIMRADRTRWAASGFDWTVVPPDPGTRPLSQDYNVIKDVMPNAVAADLDNDGRKEILFSSYDGRLYAYWLDKTQHGNWPFAAPGTGINFSSEPAVADLDNDGQAEVIIGTWPEIGGGRLGRLIVLNSKGQVLHSLPLPAPRGGNWNGALAAPTLANIDSDADLEVIVGTVYSGAVVYDLPQSAGARVLWGTGRGSFLRNGGPPQSQSGPSLQVSPSSKVIAPGESTTFSIVLNGGAANESYVLRVTTNPAGPILKLSPTSITSGTTATLTVTDPNPPGTLKPGSVHNITIQAVGSKTSIQTSVSLLVGGYQAILPLVRR